MFSLSNYFVTFWRVECSVGEEIAKYLAPLVWVVRTTHRPQIHNRAPFSHSQSISGHILPLTVRRTRWRHAPGVQSLQTTRSTGALVYRTENAASAPNWRWVEGEAAKMREREQ